MWDYRQFPTDKDLLAKFGKYSTIAGIVLFLLGLGAILYPTFASLVTVAFIAWMMIFSGLTTGYFTFISNKKDWLGWLKTLILIGTGLFLLLDPALGIETVGILFAIYFLLDGFTGIALGSSMNGVNGWWIWYLNGFISIILAMIFLYSWNSLAKEAWLIGIYVGISLLFDGLALLLMGKNIKNLK